MNGTNNAQRQLETVFGPLEIRVLEALWERGAASCVRDVQPQFPGIAYTTLMTTLDRLYRKGALTREKSGRAFYYRPKSSKHELLSHLTGSTLATLLPVDSAAMRPILSMFVDTVSERDSGLLDELEQLVRARRDELSHELNKRDSK
ncbi:MAG TPA: BlaI/MecI/CopY family transcriptional regulator [Vicinamibacterales bacterium]|nr:BlaI/MecI/CopY family transcriptional regulator [Vicinamibacterales bacterium]